MRFQVELRLESNIIEKDYRRKILSLIKQLLSREYYNEIYGEDNPYKGYTFSPYIKVDSFKNEGIVLKDKNMKIYFSVESDKIGLLLINSFKKGFNKKLPFGKENEVIIGKASTLNEKINFDTNVVFKTMSPIVIREKSEDKKDWYHDFDNKGLAVLKKNITHQFKDSFSKEILGKLEIKGIKTKRTIVKNYGISFPVTLGEIMISGDSRVIKKIYQGGLGSKKTMGFGMLEVIN